MVGESIEESNYVFTVEKLEGHRISKVHVEQHIERDDEVLVSVHGEEIVQGGGEE